MNESPSYWRSAADDEVMQDAHGFVWKAMLDTIDVDLAGTRVWTPGATGAASCACSATRAGSPRVGATTRHRARSTTPAVSPGTDRLRFEVADSVPPGWGSFDVAFSHEVLYLHPRPARARGRDLRGAGARRFVLRRSSACTATARSWPSGIAPTSTSCNSPSSTASTRSSRCSARRGFDVAAARLRFGFIPESGHHSGNDAGSFWRRIEYYNDHKIFLRCTRPAA